MAVAVGIPAEHPAGRQQAQHAVEGVGRRAARGRQALGAHRGVADVVGHAELGDDVQRSR
jgi:hypothetical protein